MTYTYEQVIELAQRSGISNHPTSTLRKGDIAQSGNLSYHDKGWAVDFDGESQDELAAFFMAQHPQELLHYSKATGKWYGWNGSKNREIDPAKNPDLVKEHTGHLHVAFSPEQLGPGSFLDQLRRGIKPAVSGVTYGLGVPGLSGVDLGSLLKPPGSVTEAIGTLGTAMTSVAQSAMSIGQVANAVTRALMPSNLLRGAAFLFGTISILIGVWFLAREVKESTP